MIILGIDPGTATTGWGLVEILPRKPLVCLGHGVILTSKEAKMPARLLIIRNQLSGLIKQYKPDALCVENLFFGLNSKTAMTVGQARGVVLATAAAARLSIFEYQGLSVKLAVAGSGRASKKEIQKAVKKHLKLKEIPKPDDAADALAVAIHHFLKINETA